MSPTDPRRPREAGERTAPPIRIGVSSCLLGQRVRYDGGHKRDRFITEVLAAYVDWVPVCPEVEVGLGVPRPSIRLQRARDGSARLVMPSTGEDLTDRMSDYASDRARSLEDLELCGFILKEGSPSCGMDGVMVHDASGGSATSGIGVFASALLRLTPNLPVEDDGRLNDPPLRENFISRVFARRRWLDMQADGITRSRLEAFHSGHELLCLARNQAGTRRLRRLLEEAPRGTSAAELADRYLAEFNSVMRRPPSVRGQVHPNPHPYELPLLNHV